MAWHRQMDFPLFIYLSNQMGFAINFHINHCIYDMYMAQSLDLAFLLKVFFFFKNVEITLVVG
jgi:hypothetical protein